MNKTLDATHLKIIAIISMVIDHFAWGFIDFYSWQGQFLHVCGRLTIPIMCFFIAQGYSKTSNLRRYVGRMVTFWLISVVPFYLFFHEEYDYRQNIIFDLLLGLLFLIVLDSKKLSRWKKVLISILLFAVSLTVGGWPVLPMVYIAIFYFVKNWKSQVKWFCIATVTLVLFMMGAIALNQMYHFSHYNWIWYEKTYFLGFMLALPLLARYNGQKGSYPVGRYFFYCFYPIHFLVLYAFKQMYHVYSGYTVYVTLQILTLVLAMYVIYKMLQERPSKAQTGSLLFGCAAIVYMFGFLLEVTTTTLSGAYQAVKVEYFGECFVVIGFTLFFSEFCKIKLSKLVYLVEYIISFVFMYLLFTTRVNHIFYKDMRIVDSVPHSRLVLEYGPGFYAFFGYLGILSILTILIYCKYMKHCTNLEKKRIRLIIYAIACPWFPLIIRASGITGGYEVSFLGVAASSLLIMTALVRYGYLDSVQLAGTNALFNANEGLMVIDTSNQILYCNKRLNEWFPEAVKYGNAADYLDINTILHGNALRITLNNCICDIISEPIIEMNETQGYLIRIMDMTEHYQKLDQAEKSAHIDALTGLWDRELFKLTMMEYLKDNGNGTMFMMDIDNFKGINDNYGHDTGDKVLITLGKTLRQICGEVHICCRIGGDEFGLFLKGITASNDIRNYSEKISSLYKQLIAETNPQVKSSISIGGTVIDDESLNITSDSFEEIYCSADKAMYVAKNGGKDRYFVNRFVENV